MSNTVIKIEDISKIYRLGEVGTGTISHDINRWWAKFRGKEDPFALVGQTNDRTKKAKSDYVYALKDINLEVKQGEILGIIGRNGAGKSTLLKILSRITKPSKGQVKVKGRIASLLEVGTGMNPEMTGRENIYLNGVIMGMTRGEITRKFDEIIDFAGCALYVDTPVKRYSSGMRVRLGFAVAAFLEPEILVVDEVLAVGDAEFQKKAIGKMKDVSKSSGRTVLFVSHNMTAIQNLCQKVIVLNNGKIGFKGSTNEGLSFYKNLNAINTESLLTQRTDIEGTKNIIISSINLTSIPPNKNLVISGKPFIIDLNYKIFKPIFDVNITIHIYDMDDEIKFVLNHKVTTGENIKELKDNGSISITINELPIQAGRYYLNISIFSNNTKHYILENANTFEVENGNFFNTGFNLKNTKSLLVHNNWLIKNG